jgi:hypothetical protein
MVRTITSKNTDASVTLASPRSRLPVGKRRAQRGALSAVPLSAVRPV